MNAKAAGNISALTEKILSSAFNVHARLGPGLLESTYTTCLVHSLRKIGMQVETEVPIAIQFDELAIPIAYRADAVVEGKVLLELKAAERVLPVHCAQVRTYLAHSRVEAALLLNFNTKSLKDGIRRFDRRAAWNDMPTAFPGTPSIPVLPAKL